MWMDIVNPGADKGSALKKLMKELELSKEEVMAFGDNINDLGMLEAAGESYAIGSARQEVKDAAKHIAPPLNIYGETIALREFLEKQGWYDTTLR
jgi:hydroxymethylpyrimidine pyrophosphatase-like HAD family hydrolase